MGKFNTSIAAMFKNDKWGKGSMIASITQDMKLDIRAGSVLLLKKAMTKQGDQWIEKLTKKGEPYFFLEIVEPVQASPQTPTPTQNEGTGSFEDWA